MLQYYFNKSYVKNKCRRVDAFFLKKIIYFFYEYILQKKKTCKVYINLPSTPSTPYKNK